MGSERMECRLEASQMNREAADHGYQGEWAQVAIAAAVFELAAAVWELKDFLAFHLQGRPEEERR